jgi:hypothetical protein
MKMNVAEKRIFDLPGMNSVQSVEKTNVHEILLYLNVQQLIQNDQNERFKDA